MQVRSDRAVVERRGDNRVVKARLRMAGAVVQIRRVSETVKA